MENVKTWQWIVIAGPAFFSGMGCAYLILREQIKELEDMLSEEEVVKEPLTSEQIANNLLWTFYDHR